MFLESLKGKPSERLGRKTSGLNGEMVGLQGGRPNPQFFRMRVFFLKRKKMDQQQKPSLMQQKKQEFRSIYGKGLSLLEISRKIGVTTPILAQWGEEIKRERLKVAAANDAANPVLNSIENISAWDDILKVVFKLLPGIILCIVLLKLVHLI